MKVLLINGSPHAEGNTRTALREMERVFAAEGIETDLVWIGNQDIRGCIVLPVIPVKKPGSAVLTT